MQKGDRMDKKEIEKIKEEIKKFKEKIGADKLIIFGSFARETLMNIAILMF